MKNFIKTHTFFVNDSFFIKTEFYEDNGAISANQVLTLQNHSNINVMNLENTVLTPVVLRRFADELDGIIEEINTKGEGNG